MRLRTFALVGAVAIVPSLADAQTAPVGASKLLTVSPQAFRDTCRADIEQARASAAQFKAATGGDWAAALDRYDAAFACSATRRRAPASRASVHPGRGDAQSGRAAARATSTRPPPSCRSTGRSTTRGALNVSRADAATQHYVEQTLRDFRRAGVDKDEATRARVKALHEELVKLGQEFDANIRQDVRTSSSSRRSSTGLPEDFMRAHPPGANGKVRVTTDNPDYLPFMTYAKTATARERCGRSYRQRGYPKNLECSSGMLEARHELATLLGYPDLGRLHHRRQDDRHATGGGDFIEKIAAAADDAHERDYAGAARAQAARRAGRDVGRRLGQRLPRGAGQGRAVRFDSQAVRPYFEYARSSRACWTSPREMFGVTLPAGARTRAVWHPDVEAYDVLEGDAAARPHLPRHAPARRQVQALRRSSR